ncbi:MAG: SpoIIE family protein phosphatase [Candidatus Latescibacteria bacterium]|nr:SpoIIE family protein phosphatase [Candidatus Latescibacterota bacterium]NIO27201.1 SpoIIE family protein phosphatase [Candidatus Latescibacterota bacterium]NIO54725.1 SpoIIE family protein phosphatase [Candidatus Latescibacterota bacterium]NIT00808.1 SpoIIE family protein phosphatase [Candidatus Latescibacterota bacterium]NIT37731.1 SpoIIE family protein phosphatase [Candidatus Latescibacterota bacterium]
MSKPLDISDLKNGYSGWWPTLVETIRLRLAAWRLMFTPFSVELRRFASWLEKQALPFAAEKGLSTLLLEITIENEIRVGGADLDEIEMPDTFLLTGAFFRSMEIECLELGVRLEENQIEDMVVFLYAHRRALTAWHRGRAAGGSVGKLVSDEGVEVSCMRTWLKENRLSVSYSYCLTPFSRVVLWFEKRHRSFGDHRALFQSAPRYALLVAGIALIPLVIYLANGSRWILLSLSILASATLFAMVYLFFMIVGSLEYDNEEKAYRLGKANQDLTNYAKRIQDDLSRARTIQEQMLPDITNMPLSGKVDWASAFDPQTEVGGDYFDVREVEPNKVAVLFADVSGHGMSAAFITAVLKAAFQGWIEESSPLEDFVRQLNRRLYALTPEDSFAAVFVGMYDHRTGELCYVNGGHSPEPLLIPADPSSPAEYLTGAPAMILGVLEDIPVEPACRVLEQGDKVLMATDGIIEATDAEGTEYGRERLEALLQRDRDEQTSKLVERLIKDVDQFANGAVQDDDRTVLAFGIKSREL